MADSKDEGRKTDLHKTGRVNTTVETQTQVVDNTTAPAAGRATEYAAESAELGGGTTLITYGEPVGGRPEAEGSEDA